MSEYQCYEFLAVDRPLTDKQIAALRTISTRAEISPTRFRNEYHFGDLHADAAKVLERYFDAHLYFAHWGTRRLMLRLPKARVDVASEKARERRLDDLGRDVGDAWRKLEQLIVASDYDDAVKLATDLTDLATRDGATRDFETRFKAMRKRQLRRRGFFDRWRRRSKDTT